MEPSILKPGQKVEIYIPSIDAYYQLLVSFVGEKTITVKEIREQQKIKGPIRLRLPEGQTYPLYIWDKHNIYSGTTKILERREEGGLIGYVIERPFDYSVRERRQSVRVSYLNKLKYMVDNEKAKLFSEVAQSVDLSGGGMRMIVQNQYSPGTLLNIKLRLDEKEFTVKGKVAWVMQKKQTYWIGIDFQNLADIEQDYIVNYVFSKLRKQMK